MTKQRFEYSEAETGCNIWDNEDRDAYCFDFNLEDKENVKTLCNRLNQLHEKNLKLEKELSEK